MDARGFGRTGEISRRQRRLVATGVLAGLLAIVVSVYEILDVGSPVLAGVPLLVAGTALAVVAVLFGGRHRSRTTYRPASWRAAEWVVLAAGVAAIAGVLVGGRVQPGSLHTTVYPMAVPQLPWPTLVGIALALLPVVLMNTALHCDAAVSCSTRRRTRGGAPMIRFESVTITYPDADGPALRDVELFVPEGELVLVIGRTGAGKSTLLKAINGLVPHFSGGTLVGRVTVDGRDTRTHPPREFCDLVGYVGQDPLAGFVTDVVDEELAYAMESLRISPDVMRRRVEDIIDLLGLAPVRRRSLTTLSAGEQQRVAIGSVLTAGARVLVLDEPTSALDPPAADDVLAALTRLVHDLGITVVAAEHRLERVIHYADRIVQVDDDGSVHDTTPRQAMQRSAVAPPVVELGRLAQWQPLPLSVRDARRAADSLRARLASLPALAGATRPDR